MKGYREFLNESKESYNDKGFWNGVSKELAKQLKPYKVKLAKFRVDKYSRTITYEFKQRANSFILEIAHDWGRDGSEGKPDTTFTVNVSDGETFTEDLGRFAIWDELNYVAEDIINVMKSMEGEELAQWIFESVVNESCDVHSSYDEDCDDCVAGETNEKEFKPHMMYDTETGKAYKAEKPEDHERMSKLGYTHKK